MSKESFPRKSSSPAASQSSGSRKQKANVFLVRELTKYINGASDGAMHMQTARTLRDQLVRDTEVADLRTKINKSRARVHKRSSRKRRSHKRKSRKRKSRKRRSRKR